MFSIGHIPQMFEVSMEECTDCAVLIHGQLFGRVYIYKSNNLFLPPLC